MNTGPLTILHNGALVLPDQEQERLLNRALRLGDGFFETIRLIDGLPHAWPAHFARMQACFKALSLEPQSHLDAPFFERAICKLALEHGTTNARVRITFYRQGKGTYKPDSNRLGFIIELAPMEHGYFEVKEEGLHLGLYTSLMKFRSPLAPFKLLGNHVYIQAAIWAQREHYDDALVCNDVGAIIEATSSNLFVVSKGAILTPSLTSGCVGGVMRMAVINAALEAKITCYETELDEQDLLEATEIFLTNAVRGLSWVRSFRDRRYFHKVSDLLVGEINKRHRAQKLGLERASSI